LVYLSAENGLATNFKGYSKSMQLDDDFVTKTSKNLCNKKNEKLQMPGLDLRTGTSNVEILAINENTHRLDVKRLR
jgi:hypothetical protein